MSINQLNTWIKCLMPQKLLHYCNLAQNMKIVFRLFFRFFSRKFYYFYNWSLKSDWRLDNAYIKYYRSFTFSATFVFFCVCLLVVRCLFAIRFEEMRWFLLSTSFCFFRSLGSLYVVDDAVDVSGFFSSVLSRLEFWGFDCIDISVAPNTCA